MTAPADDHDLAVYCRNCHSTLFTTSQCYRTAQGDVRTHRCLACGHEFGSLATFIERALCAKSKWTPLMPVILTRT